MEGVYDPQNNFPAVKQEPGLNGSQEHNNGDGAEPPKADGDVKEEKKRSSRHKDSDRDRERKRSRDRKRRRSRSRDRESRRYCIQYHAWYIYWVNLSCII